jgi:hypothetical protein
LITVITIFVIRLSHEVIRAKFIGHYTLSLVKRLNDHETEIEHYETRLDGVSRIRIREMSKSGDLIRSKVRVLVRIRSKFRGRVRVRSRG